MGERMKYILIIVILTTSGVGSSTAEFDNAETCKSAAAFITDSLSGYMRTAMAECVPK
jgi:hypothetical protein